MNAGNGAANRSVDPHCMADGGCERNDDADHNIHWLWHSYGVGDERSEYPRDHDGDRYDE